MAITVMLLHPVATAAEHGVGAFVDLDATTVLQAAYFSVPVRGHGASAPGYMLGSHSGASASGEHTPGQGPFSSSAADLLHAGAHEAEIELSASEDMPAPTAARKVKEGIFVVVGLLVVPLYAVSRWFWQAIALARGSPGALVFLVAGSQLVVLQTTLVALIASIAVQLSASMLEERLTRSTRFEQMLDGVVGVAEQPKTNRTGLARATMHP